MDEENFFWSEPLNVDAIVANDGDEFLYNADADAQGDENFYGQNQSLAGDSGWWDDNYPGQTVQNPDTVSNTTDYGDYGSSTGEGAAGTSTTVTLDPYAQQATVQRSLSALTSKATSPTQDAFGLTILDAAQTAQLTRGFNPAFVNGFAPAVNTGTGAAIAAANQQTAAAAARLNAESPNPYLANIDQAAAEISRGQDGKIGRAHV